MRWPRALGVCGERSTVRRGVAWRGVVQLEPFAAFGSLVARSESLTRRCTTGFIDLIIIIIIIEIIISVC